MTYSEIIETVATNLAENFDEVYHSVEIISENDKRQPAVPSGDEWLPLAPTDQRETVYIRRMGNDSVSSDLKLGSCVLSYAMRTPIRIVYFKDRADKHGEIVEKLLRSILIQNVILRSVIRDKWRLMKEENNLNIGAGATTAYYAVDVEVIWDLIPNTCEQNFCIELDNPVKKCSTIIINS